jgi:hypothetical protein
MLTHYDEDFVEGAVSLCTSGGHAAIPTAQIRRFQAEREKCYAVLDPDERNAAFFQVHLAWFREWRLDQTLQSFVEEFPLLTKALHLLAWRKARTQSDEGAELYVQSRAGVSPAQSSARRCDTVSASDAAGAAGTGETPALPSRNAVVAMRPERFERNGCLGLFLRHELTHLHDMVDPSFGYSPELPPLGRVTAPPRLIRERYRLLWDITIDARLRRVGHAVSGTREQQEKLFQRAYAFWGEEQRRSVFGELSSTLEPRHARLLTLAADPRDLAHAAGPLPGSPCPLCGFSTFEWAAVGLLNDSSRARLKSEFPHWIPEQGLCKRCAETYEVSGQFELPPTVCL